MKIRNLMCWLPMSISMLSLQAASAAEKFKVDDVHSSVIFRINHVGAGNFYGRFNKVSGSFTIDEGSPDASLIDVTVAADSLDTNNDGRDKHLKGPDFFNAKQFPELKFKSKSFKKNGDKAFDVTGDLTCHGVTKPITVKIEQTGTSDAMGHRSGIETMFTINRTDYGMGAMPDKLGTEVRLIVALEGVK